MLVFLPTMKAVQTFSSHLPNPFYCPQGTYHMKMVALANLIYQALRYFQTHVNESQKCLNPNYILAMSLQIPIPSRPCSLQVGEG